MFFNFSESMYSTTRMGHETWAIGFFFTKEGSEFVHQAGFTEEDKEVIEEGIGFIKNERRDERRRYFW